MKFEDYSPPTVPAVDQQRDALRKGLGRAMQWASREQLDDAPLLEACLRDQRYDKQVEVSRGNWLWQMIQAVNGMDRFRVPIRNAFYELADEQSAVQLCELAKHFAKDGDNTFRSRLYEIVEQTPFTEMPWLAEKEIIALDGVSALAFAIRVHGRALANREWGWDDEHLIGIASEKLGEVSVGQLLDNSTEDAIREFRRQLHQERKKKADQQPAFSYKERVRGITVSEIIAAAESEDPGFGMYRVWGMQAAPADLRIVLQRLWAAQGPKVIKNYLTVFSNRALPEFDARLIELCQHGDDNVCRWAFAALKMNAHPMVREFALTGFSKRECDGSVVNLFINNYEQGDDLRILEAMALPDDEFDLHSLLMAVNNVLEKNPRADVSRLGVITYASTPCEICRFNAFRLLHGQKVVPLWMMEERKYDSGHDDGELLGYS